MKIMLVSPGPVGKCEFMPQLGLTYISAYLKKNGYPDVSYVDYMRSGEKGYIQRLTQERPDMIGINTYTPTRHFSYRAAELAKEVLPGCKTVVGGIHVTFLPEQHVEHFRAIDYACFGEGEQTMLELVRCLEQNGDPADVPGLCHRQNGKVVRNAPRVQFQDLDQLPFPEYFDHDAELCGGHVKAASMITSRGCGSGCKFCSVPSAWGKQRLRSPQNVIEEIKWLVRDHQVEYIWFMDDSFTLHEEPTRVLLEGMIKENFPVRWRCATRVNVVNKDLLKLMRQAGCHRISFGVESGSEKILKTMQKGITVGEAENACRWSKEAGLVVEVNFMTGSPGEIRETIDETKALIRRIRPDEFNVSNALYFYPGTAIYRMGKQKHMVDDDIWLTDVRDIPYTAEHTLEQLSLWQKELIHACGRSLGFWKYLWYLWSQARKLSLRAIARECYFFFMVLLKEFFRDIKKSSHA